MAKKSSPIVTCPGCKKPMKPVKNERVPNLKNVEQVTFRCSSCGTVTVRPLKRTDK